MLADFPWSHLILEPDAVLCAVFCTFTTEAIHILAAKHQVQSLGNLRQADLSTQTKLELVIEALVPVIDGPQSESRLGLFKVALVVSEKIIDPLGHLVRLQRGVFLPRINPTRVFGLYYLVGDDFVADG